MACVLLEGSDDLWTSFGRDGELADAVRQQHSGEALSLCQWLEDVANERGGHDNVTVAVLVEKPNVIPSEQADASGSAASPEPQNG